MVFPNPDWMYDERGNLLCTCRKWQGDEPRCPYHGEDFCWAERELTKEPKREEQSKKGRQK